LASNEGKSRLGRNNFTLFLEALDQFIGIAGSRDVKSKCWPIHDDPVLQRAKQGLDMLRDNQSLVDGLVEASKLPGPTGISLFHLVTFDRAQR